MERGEATGVIASPGRTETAAFSGLGTLSGQLTELRRVARVPVVHSFLCMLSTQLDEEILQLSPAQRAAHLEHGLDIATWASSTAVECPTLKYLSSSSVTLVLTFAIQLANFRYVWAQNGSFPAAAATGHSQGLAAAIVVALTGSERTFDEYAALFARALLRFGLAVARHVPCADTEGGYALAVLKWSTSEVAALIERSGCPVHLVVRNGACACTLTGRPAALATFHQMLPAGVSSKRLAVPAPFHALGSVVSSTDAADPHPGPHPDPHPDPDRRPRPLSESVVCATDAAVGQSAEVEGSRTVRQGEGPAAAARGHDTGHGVQGEGSGASWWRSCLTGLRLPDGVCLSSPAAHSTLGVGVSSAGSLSLRVGHDTGHRVQGVGVSSAGSLSLRVGHDTGHRVQGVGVSSAGVSSAGVSSAALRRPCFSCVDGAELSSQHVPCLLVYLADALALYPVDWPTTVRAVAEHAGMLCCAALCCATLCLLCCAALCMLCALCYASPCMYCCRRLADSGRC